MLVKDDALVITGWAGGDPTVSGGPCKWASTMPDGPATTLDAPGNQATRDASEPVDVSVDGFPGRAITLHVPDAPFTDCDEGKLCTLSFGDGADCHMWYHERSAIDEPWVIDRDGQFTCTAGSYCADTRAETVEELRAILASMTFGNRPMGAAR